MAEHRARGLPKESLSSTLALVSAIRLSDTIPEHLVQVTTCNSLLAIFAGLLSDLLVRGLSLGPLAPFLAALVIHLYLSFTEYFKGDSDRPPAMLHKSYSFVANIFSSLAWRPDFS